MVDEGEQKRYIRYPALEIVEFVDRFGAGMMFAGRPRPTCLEFKIAYEVLSRLVKASKAA